MHESTWSLKQMNILPPDRWFPSVTGTREHELFGFSRRHLFLPPQEISRMVFKKKASAHSLNVSSVLAETPQNSVKYDQIFHVILREGFLLQTTVNFSWVGSLPCCNNWPSFFRLLNSFHLWTTDGSANYLLQISQINSSTKPLSSSYLTGQPIKSRTVVMNWSQNN